MTTKWEALHSNYDPFNMYSLLRIGVCDSVFLAHTDLWSVGGANDQDLSVCARGTALHLHQQLCLQSPASVMLLCNEHGKVWW